jgi:hypothetical protein
MFSPEYPMNNTPPEIAPGRERRERREKIGSIFDINATICPPLPHPPYGFQYGSSMISTESRLIKSMKFITSIKCQINYLFFFLHFGK